MRINPLMLLAGLIMYVNDLCYLISALIRYSYFSWAESQNLHLPAQYGIGPKQNALAEIYLLSADLGLTQPWLELCRIVAGIKKWSSHG